MKKSERACREIRSAANEGQVIAAVQDYLSSLDSADAAGLPPDVLAIAFEKTEEIVHYALHVAHTDLSARGHSPKGAALKEVVKVFSAAALRLAALQKNDA